MILFGVSLVGVGCIRVQISRGNQTSQADREAQLRQIAADYVLNQDLAQAQKALDTLNVANPAQLLVTLAEQDINAGRSPEEITALARLADALGAHSARLIAYLAPTPTPSPMPPSSTPVPPSPTPVPLTETSIPASPTTTATVLPPTETSSPPPQAPRVQTDSAVNLRGGPGTVYPVIGRLQASQEVDIIGRNASGDWWRLAWDGQGQAWVAGTVVHVLGPIDTVAMAENIPTPPPTAIPATPKPTDTPTPAGPDFQLVGKRLWSVEENGGWFDGPSVHCGEKRQLRVIVLDAAGNPLNGVTVKAALANKEEEVTGSKGPGIAEFVLGGGQEVFIIRDVDSRSVTSDYASGMTTSTSAIPNEYLKDAGYCTTDEQCAYFKTQGCDGHFSWDVTYRRAY